MATEAVPLYGELTDLIVAQADDAILVWNRESVADNPAAKCFMGTGSEGKTLADAERILGEAYDSGGGAAPSLRQPTWRSRCVGYPVISLVN